jgi:autotransporter-associated beta strand protein
MTGPEAPNLVRACPDRRRRGGSKRRLTPLGLERLETRVLLADSIFTWTGAASNLWSNPNNWSPQQVPPSSDFTDLIFPAGAANPTMIVDLNGASLGTLAFQAGGYSLAGDSLSVLAISNVAGTNQVSVPITLASPGTNIAAQTGSTLNLTASLNIGSTGTFLNENTGAVDPVDGGGTLNISGPISGVGPLFDAGAGLVNLSGANVYLGGTVIPGGILALGSSSALGSGPLTLGVIQASAPSLTIPNTFTVGSGGGGVNGGSSVTLSGPGTLSGPFSIAFPSSETTVTLSGPLSGPGGINVGRGTLALSGANTFSGGTDIQSGTVVVAGATALGSGTVSLDGGSIQASGNQTVANAFQVTSNGGLVNGAGDLTFSGPGSIFGSLAITSSGTTTFSGTLSGAGGVFASGTGTVHFAGTGTYTGQIQAVLGTVVVDGVLGGSSVSLIASTLRGDGTVGPIATQGATIAPGDPGQTGVLTAAGAVALVSQSTFAVDLNGATAGTGYDQLVVSSGGISLTGAALKTSLGYKPTVGDVLTIISSPGGVTGTFSGLANGSIVTIGSQPFQINYTSNTVTLTAVSGTTAAARFNLTPYTQSLMAGPSSTQADVNGDGSPDTIAARSTGQGPALIVTSSRTSARLLKIPLTGSLRGGRVRLATADVDGDGSPDIIVATGPARRLSLRVFSGRSGMLLRNLPASGTH